MIHSVTAADFAVVAFMSLKISPSYISFFHGYGIIFFFHVVFKAFFGIFTDGGNAELFTQAVEGEEVALVRSTVISKFFN